MTFAGLWDLWRDPSAPDRKPLQSFAIITTQANDMLKPLHGRMPALLPPNAWSAWLGESPASERELKAMLKPYPSAAMAFWPVGRLVGNIKNDSPDLFAPLGELPLGAGVIGKTPEQGSRLPG